MSIPNIDTVAKLSRHLEKIENLNLPIELIRGVEAKGREIYSKDTELRDVSTLMEHPEFARLYYIYMKNFEKFKRFMILLKLYDMISRKLYACDPEEKCHNSYHKLFILYNLMHNRAYARALSLAGEKNRLT